jgi:hypothetical protein
MRIRRRYERFAASLSAVLAALCLGSVVAPGAAAEAIPCVFSGIPRIVAVGDIHGDYDNFVNILKGTGVVDADLRWSAGRGHFVQNGDILDRGPRARDIFDLLRRLEAEAAAAGGMVHTLLGNHEEMNITGIVFDYPDYITIEQFVSFLPEKYRAAREREFLGELERDASATAAAKVLDLAGNGRLRRFWQEVMKRGEGREAYMRFFIDTYGPWIMSHNTVVKINDIVFMHGGISEKYSTWRLEELNESIRRELREFRGSLNLNQILEGSFKREFVYEPSSPLWFRDLAMQDEASARDVVDRILANLGARAIVIAHTFYRGRNGSPIVSIASMSRFGNRVWIIDTGISSAYGGVPSALIVENGNFILWGGSEEEAPIAVSPILPEAPRASPSEIEAFLRTARVVEIQKSDEKGRTAPWRVILDGGGVLRRAMFKYVDRRRPHPFADSWRYELAAYELNRAFGLTLVPPAVEREIDGVTGSLQIFMEGAIRVEDLPRATGRAEDGRTDRALRSCRVFENLVSNACADARDTYVMPDDGRIFRVDFSSAFSPAARLLPDCEITCSSRTLYRALLGWDDRDMAAALAPYLNADERDALGKRRKFIIDKIAALIREKGEAAILF